MPTERPRFVVEGVLPVGLLLFAASPKSGKTRLLIQLGASVSRGENALGRYPTQQGTVLYYALEDGKTRFTEHAKGLDIPECENLVVFDSVSSATDGGDYSWLRDDMRQYSDVRLVIIDVLNRVMVKKDSGKGAYHDEAQALMPLQQIANEAGVAIIAVHHTRKSTEGSSPLLAVNGTNALTGTADNIWVLERPPLTGAGKLTITGRDVREQVIELAFSEESGSWGLKGSGSRFAIKLPKEGTDGRINAALDQLLGADPIARSELLDEVSRRVDAVGEKYLDTRLTKCLKDRVSSGLVVETTLPGKGAPKAYSLLQAA